MHSHEIIKRALQQRGAKQVASDLDVSLSLLYKWSEPSTQSGATNPLDKTVELAAACGNTVVLEWLCQRFGGVFVKNPDARQGRVDVLVETQRILKEFSDVLSAVSTAWADARVSPTEAAAIRKEWDELKSVAETFVLACEHRDPAHQPRAR